MVRAASVSVVLFLVCCLGGNAQDAPGNFHVGGTVTDTEGQPLEGAKVTVQNSGQSATADSRGTFLIEGLRPGRHDITAHLPGLRTQMQRITVPMPERTQLKFELTVGDSPYPHVVHLEPRERLRNVDSIAHVRLAGFVHDIIECDVESLLSLREATVVAAWKGTLPQKIQIWERDTGTCSQRDGSLEVSTATTPTLAGSQYVVFLHGRPPRFHSVTSGVTALPVMGTMVDTSGYMGLPRSMELKAFQQAVSKLQR